MFDRLRHSRRWQSGNRWPLLTLACLAAAFIATGASQPGNRTVVQVSEEVEVESAPQAVSPADVDILGVWIKAAQETLGKVRDYQCTFVKRERIDGVLQDEQVSQMKIRHQPFSVHLKMVAPKAVAGREAVYVIGRHNNKMRAKGSGALSLVGFVTLNPRDPRAMAGNRHDITEAGIGNLLKSIAAAHDQPRPAGQPSSTTVTEVTFNHRPCVRLEVIDPTADNVRNCYRSVIYFDKDTNLPLRYEGYDRPRTGAPEGDLMEMYSYIDCHFNVNLTDAAFNY